MLKPRVNLHGSAELSAAYIRLLPPDKIKYTRPPFWDITVLMIHGGQQQEISICSSHSDPNPHHSCCIPKVPPQGPRSRSWVQEGLCLRRSPCPSITSLPCDRLGAAEGLPLPYFPFISARSKVSIISAWSCAFNNLTSSTVFI